MNNGRIKVLIPSESSQQKKVSFIALRNLHGAQQLDRIWFWFWKIWTYRKNESRKDSYGSISNCSQMNFNNYTSIGECQK